MMIDVASFSGRDPMNESTSTFRKSTYSQGASNCAEVGQVATAIQVGDTKDPAGPRLPVDPAAWRAFVTRLRCYGDA